MIYTELTKKAMKLCFEAHKDQVDKSGMPYVFHPFHVAESFTGVPGEFVRTEDTIKGFEAILGGECDNIPEQAFLLSGNIDSVYAKSKEL